MSNKQLVKRISGVLIILFSIFLFLVMIWSILYDIDFFITKKEGLGSYHVISNKENKIKIALNYYDSYKSTTKTKTKSYRIGYLSEIQAIDSNKSPLIYTKWFSQVYLGRIKTPTFLILLLEIAMVWFAVIGIKAGLREITGTGN